MNTDVSDETHYNWGLHILVNTHCIEVEIGIEICLHLQQTLLRQQQAYDRAQQMMARKCTRLMTSWRRDIPPRFEVLQPRLAVEEPFELLHPCLSQRALNAVNLGTQQSQNLGLHAPAMTANGC